ncbi:hypothetical protein GCM10020216_016130 [Nonomuraea helvata]
MRAKEALPGTPEQMAGTSRGLPSLVDTAVTQPKAGKSKSRAADGHVRPKGALPVEQRALVTSTAADEPCRGYTVWYARNYAAGEQVAYMNSARQWRVWTAGRLGAPGLVAPGSQNDFGYWIDSGGCLTTNPDPVQNPPSLVEVFPYDGMLVSSLTPVLGARGYSNAGSWVLYSFSVCLKGTTSGCRNSGSLGPGQWRVPASAKLEWGKEYTWTVTVSDHLNGLTTSWTGSFTTGVRQPSVSSLLSTPNPGGQEFLPATGNYTTNFTDVTVPTAGLPLSVMRSYNSLDPRRDGMFGAGWSTPWDAKVVPESTRGRPVGEWRMDEGSGTTAADASGGGHPITANGTAAWGTGRVGKAVTLDGQGALGTTGQVVHTNKSFSVSAWVKLGRGDQDMAVVSQDGAVNSGFKLAYGPSDQKWRMLMFQDDANSSAYTRQVSSETAQLNRWTHLVGVYDQTAGQLRLYVDGVLVGQSAHTSTWDAQGAFQIGRAKGNGYMVDRLTGAIDDVAVYGRAMTDDEVRQLYEGWHDSLLVTYPDGRQVRFQANGDGTFQSPPGMFATASQTASGWQVMDKAGVTYVFDATGRLVRVNDSRGRGQDLAYGTDGRLAKVTATGGRSLTFGWGGGHVTSVSTDPVDGAALTWTYGYEGDKLVRACSPDHKCTTFDYGTGSQYASVVANSDPVGYWRLGEAAGASTAVDSARSAGDATYTQVTLGQPGPLGGSTNTAAKLTGQSDITLPRHLFARLGDAVSFEAWFNTTQPGTILTVGGNTAEGAQSALYVGTDGKLRGQYRASLTPAPQPITSSAAVSDGAWHHVALTLAGGVQRLYLDGQEVGFAPGTGLGEWPETSQLGKGFLAGKWPASPTGGASFALTGLLDEAAVYDHALSPAEVGQHVAARAAAPHLMSKITLPSGRVWMQTTYDTATDRVVTHTDVHGGTWKVGEPSVNASSGISTVTVTDPAGEPVIYTYDGWRGLRLTSRTDQLGKQTSYAYDTGGFVAKVTDPNTNTIQYANDAHGNVVATTTCRTGTCQTAHAEYYLNTNDPFDPRNDRPTKLRDARSASATDNTYATTLEYNSFGEQLKQTTPATSDFPNGRATSIAYTDGSEAAVGGGTTPAGLVKSKTDARGSTWEYRYTAAGDLAEQTSPTGLVTKLTYDALGRPRTSTEISAAHPDGVTTTLTYDPGSRPATRTLPGVKNEISGVTHTQQTSYAYDDDGNMLSETVADLTGGDSQRVTTYAYDDHGRVESTTDSEGGVLRQAWNTLGQVARVTDPLGVVVENGYSKRGELTSRTLKGWTGSPVAPQPAKDVVLEAFSYDPGGRLATQVDAMGRKTSYIYHGDNLLSQKIADDVKLNGSTTPRDVVLEAHTYDAAGHRIKLVTSVNATTSTTTDFEYDAAARLTSQTFDTAALKRKTAFVYDANNNPIKATLTAAGTTRSEVQELAYNKANQVTKRTVENGDTDLVTSTTYDERGLATSSTDPRGNAEGATAADFTSTMRYDALGRLVEATGPQVKVDKAGVTRDARPTVRSGYDTFGQLTHSVDAEGRTTITGFDKAGRPTSVTAPPYTPPGGTTITPNVTRAYDAAGQVIRTTDPRGYVTGFEYDQLGRQVRITDPAPDGQTPGRTVIEYDLAGEKLATIDPTGARSEATYDDLGRQITGTQIERKPTSAAYTTTMEYDDAGRLLKQTAPGSKATSYTVNAAGEVTTVTDPLTNKTTMDYDLAGRLIKTTDPNRNVTTAEYDLAGRKTVAKDLDATGAVLRTFGYGYDAAGNEISATSPESHVTKQIFDALNRATSLIEPVSADKSITTSFGYDATGARTRITDGRGNATWTTYNSLGLVETVTEPSTTAHPNAADRTWTQIYDKAGNQTATIQPGGVRIDRTFDHLGRLTKETGEGGGAATAERTFGYDLAGRPTTAGDLTVDFNDRSLPLKVSRGSTQETAYGYDELGNPTQRTDAAGTAIFTWDNANRLKTATDPLTARTLTYGYDPASRLMTITATSGTASTQTIDYDNMDRVTGQTLKNGSGTQLAQITYKWDKDDNLTTKTTTGLAGPGTNTYGYDHAGRLTSWTAPGGATTAYEWDAGGNRTKAGNATFTYDERNRLTSGDGTDYTYTPRGTLATSTKAGATTNYTFDAFDRLIADGDSLYSYDALDRMTSRIRGTTKQTFAYAGLSNDLAAITDSSGAIQAKYARDPGGGLLGLMEGTGAAVAALSDLHGDLVATFTTSLQTSTAYDPYGTVTAQTGTKVGLGYQGEYTDPDTGKVNMHARWYQPGSGTFTSRDTATLTPNPSVQANRYAYANASPLTGTDPSGHYTVDSGSLAGTSYGGFGSSGYTTISAGSYSSSGSSGGGQCIGSCGSRGDIGGGATACDILSCGSADVIDPTWIRQFEWNPYIGNEELARLGWEVMPNGRPVDQPNFWYASEKVQNEYMANWSPTMTDEQLAFSWVSAGGLESFAAMERAAREHSADPRLGEWRRMQQVAAKLGYSSYAVPQNASNGTAASRYKYYSQYKSIIRHWKAINDAARTHGIDRNVLTAVVLFESKDWEVQLGKAGATLAAVKEAILRRDPAGGWAASAGVVQLEAYKARWMLIKYYGKEWEKASLGKVIDQLMNPSRAIHLAAAYLRHLKKTIVYKDPSTGRLTHINDKQAALAYCGCSGVTVKDPTTASINDLQYSKFVRWLETGVLDRDDAHIAYGRQATLKGYWSTRGVAEEYWKCINERRGGGTCP